MSPAAVLSAGRYCYLQLRRREAEAVDLADEFLETTPTPEAENDSDGVFATLYRPNGTSLTSAF